MVKKIKLEILGIFSNHPQDTNFTLLLGEVLGYRKLPIMIGVIEAQSIALAFEGSVLERPMIHDLFKDTLVKLGCTVKETIITSLKNEVFFANLLITDGKQSIFLDSRPSDAIAISLRFGAPLFINEALLNQVGSILIPKYTPADISSELANSDIKTQPTDTAITNLGSYSVKALKELLTWVVEREDYEQAALIRDELQRREK